MFKKLEFKVGDQRMTFGEFLEQEKERRGIRTWKQFEEEVLGGLRTYTYRQRDATPSEGIFTQILERTGRTEEEFIVERHIPKRGSPEYTDTLRTIGDFILKVNEQLPEGKKQLFSTTVVVAAAGDAFCRRLAGSCDDRKSMLEDLHRIDPRYESIELQTGQGGMPHRRRMTAAEEDAIETALIEFLDSDQSQDRSSFVYERLTQAFGPGYNRSRGTVIAHIRTMMDGKRPLWTFTNGSPHTNGKLSRHINERLDELTTADDQVPAELEQIVEADPGKERRAHFMSKAATGHQQLLAYLLHKENYQRHLGNVELLWADFRKEDTPTDLWEEHSAALEDIVDLEQREREAISFADHFLRCDMIFRHLNNGCEGGYVVVEVKQHAVDRSSVSESGEVTGYDNASRARQQLAGYTAVIKDNIEFRNRQRGLAEAPLKEEVRGVLIAYEIDPQLKNFLNSKEWRGAAEVPREDVLAYLQAGKRPEAAATQAYAQEAIPSKEADTPPPDVQQTQYTGKTAAPTPSPETVMRGVLTETIPSAQKSAMQSARELRTSNRDRKEVFRIFEGIMRERDTYIQGTAVIDAEKMVVRVPIKGGEPFYFEVGDIKAHRRKLKHMVDAGLLERGSIQSYDAPYQM